YCARKQAIDSKATGCARGAEPIASKFYCLRLKPFIPLYHSPDRNKYSTSTLERESRRARKKARRNARRKGRHNETISNSFGDLLRIGLSALVMECGGAGFS